VKLKGVVSDAELFEMYARATVGIIPLKRGSGMKVKITELLSAGIPTITTIVGSEGLDVINGKEVIIENNMTKFPEWIKKLVNDDEFNRLLSENGRKHVMKLTWDRALETYIHVYNKLRSKYIETYSPS
jgi:glycosyltransferase involved in cell wall biosynthesis